MNEDVTYTCAILLKRSFRLTVPSYKEIKCQEKNISEHNSLVIYCIDSINTSK